MVFSVAAPKSADNLGIHKRSLRLGVFAGIVGLLCLLAGHQLSRANPKIAFLGDSITEGWRYPTTNFGVHGNTTSQMLARFPDRIPGHGYRQVVILGGTNDVLTKTDPAVTIHNLEILGNETIQAGAKPILCEIPPIFHSFTKSDTKDYSQPVRELNARIARLAAQHGWRLVDYYDPMLGHPTYSSDGVHMKRRGYLVMQLALLRTEWTRG